MEQTAQAVNEVEVKESRKSSLMQRVWAKMGKEEKGFTLIELLAVLVIVAVIAIIAIPLISNIINNSKQDADLATARQIYDATRLYVTSEKNGDFQGTETTTDGVTSKNLVVTVIGTGDTVQGKGFLDSTLYMPSNKKAISSGTVTFKNGNLVSVDISTGNGAGDVTHSYEAAKVLSSTK